MTGAPLKLLAGVRVVAFTQFLLGPAAAQYLADMGADVVKVEPPVKGSYERTWSGAGSFVNGVSTFFLLAHRNVRSVGIDLKHEEGRRVALDLCRRADVVLVNFRPGVMEKLGLAWLRDRIGKLPSDSHWQTLAKGSMRDDLAGLQRTLAGNVLANGQDNDAGWLVSAWEARSREAMERAARLLAELRAAPALDLAMLSVGLRELRNLA